MGYATLKPKNIMIEPSMNSGAADFWHNIFQQTLAFADYQIARLQWRGQPNGVLPHGYDANSLAAQAILETLNEFPELSTIAQPSEPVRLLWQIRRHVLKHVTRLHHLKENFIVSNADDLARVTDMDGALVSPVALIPDPRPHPAQVLADKESAEEFHRTKARFQAALDSQPLRALLDLRCDGIHKPKALAARLSLPVRAVENLQARLRRKWLRFRQEHPGRSRCQTRQRDLSPGQQFVQNRKIICTSHAGI